jgi:uncharacterized glyoxalase superfamily protein PhnB
MNAQNKPDAKVAREQKIVPHLVCTGAADAIEFYKKAFGAEELMRLQGPDGKLIHASISINGGTVMLNDEFDYMSNVSPQSLKGTPVTMHLIVDDVDSFVERAESAGATVIMPVDDMFWGDRYGVIQDPFGHRWSIATPGRQMSEAEMREAASAAMTA